MLIATLQFTVFEKEGKKRYMPASKMAQLHCVINNLVALDEDDIKFLILSGYTIIEDDQNQI